MKSQGLRRAKTRHDKRRASEGATKETRSYEVAHVHALWHLDFHEASRKVMTKEGHYRSAKAFAVIDDHTRIICHVQWYLAEDTARLVHGFVQALLKRGLPGELMHDNGVAMTSAEFQQGLQDLGITSCPTLAYSPHQNGKMEKFWDALEGTVLALLDNVEPLTTQTFGNSNRACFYHYL